MTEPPESVKKLVGAIVDFALSRCEREGYSQREFFAVMQAEQEKQTAQKLTTLFARVFRRLHLMRN